MNIFDYAMQMEKNGEAYYKEMSSKTSNAGLKKIFDFLAYEEAKHYSIFKAMKENTPFELQETDVFNNAKNIFSKMKEDKENLTDLEMPLEEGYKKAQEFEKKFIDFYLSKSKEVQDETQKEIFIKIAAEENKHYRLLDIMIEFVASPNTWLENAEWNHLDEDY